MNKIFIGGKTFIAVIELIIQTLLARGIYTMDKVMLNLSIVEYILVY